MIYYRTPSARPESRPPELIGWSAFCIYTLSEHIESGWRYVGIGQPDSLSGTVWFTPPMAGAWRDIGKGWEVCVTDQAWSALMFARTANTFDVFTIEFGGQEWLVPSVVGETGQRSFKVKFGPGFVPSLTAQQTEAVNRALEIRACHESGNWPPMQQQAECAAWFLGLCYHLSPATIAAAELLDEAAVRKILLLAAGYSADGT